MTKPFDPTKPFRTRDGRAARLLCADLKNPQPILAAIVERDSGKEWPAMFWPSGICYLDGRNSPSDLINIPVKHSGWVNGYTNGAVVVGLYPAREEADREAGARRIACIRVEFEEGEGL